MKASASIFDRIRVKPDKEQLLRASCPACEWPGCEGSATHRAPKGRLKEGEYWRFCLDHVREYNKSYNYFDGMSDAAVMRFHKDSLTGHRPTWRMGVRGGRSGAKGAEAFAGDDPFNLFDEVGGARAYGASSSRPTETKVVRNAERKALDVLGLEASATAAEVKARYKVLVKRHHPDANGGDRACEDKLREIIQAYSYLKQAGFV